MKTKILKFSLLTAILGIGLWSCNKEEIIPDSVVKTNETVNLNQNESEPFSINDHLIQIGNQLTIDNKTFVDVSFSEQVQQNLIIESYGESFFQKLFYSVDLFKNAPCPTVNSNLVTNYLGQLDNIYDSELDFDSITTSIEEVRLNINSSNLNLQEKQALNNFINSNFEIINFIKNNPSKFGVNLDDYPEAITAGWWNSWGRCAFMVAASVAVTASATAIAIGTAGAGASLAWWLVGKAVATVSVIDGC